MSRTGARRVNLSACRNREDTAESAEALLIREERDQAIQAALATLPYRERQIVVLYFGIGCHSRSVRELAPLFCVSRPRIYQLLSRALYKLRRSVSRSSLSLVRSLAVYGGECVKRTS